MTDGERVKNFYLNFGLSWKGYFVRLAIATIKDLTTTLDELDFYTNRIKINDAILSALKKEFTEQSFGMLNVIDVQLRAITLQPKLEAAIEDKLIE
jgi:hypothetical protein